MTVAKIAPRDSGRTEDADPPATLFAALARFQADLPRIVKGNTAKVPGKDGKQGYTYDYADLADVSDAVLKRLGALGLFFTARPRHRQEDGKFGLDYTLGHVSGEREDGWWELRSDLPMQQMGGMITYARRYCLLAVTGAHPDGEDDDAASTQQTASRQSAGDAFEQATTARPQQDSGRGKAAQLRAEAAAVTTDAAVVRVARTASAAKDQGLITRDECDHIQHIARKRIESLRQAAHPVDVEELAGQAASAADEAAEADPATTPQIGAIWTILSTVYKFTRDEKDQARAVCAHVIGRPLETTKDMTKSEAGAVLDALASWQEVAERHEEQPREFLIELLATAEKAGGDTNAAAV